MKTLLAGVVAAAGLVVAVDAYADDRPGVTAASVFRMPKAEAIGAALGAVVSVNVAARIRKRRDKPKPRECAAAAAARDGAARAATDDAERRNAGPAMPRSRRWAS